MYISISNHRDDRRVRIAIGSLSDKGDKQTTVFRGDDEYID